MSVRARLLVCACLALGGAGCGRDYRPPDLPTTDAPSGPVGQVLDVEVALPNLQVVGADFAGLELEVRFELERGGYGEIPARVYFESARVPLGSVEVEDLSSGRTHVTVTAERWLTERLGPLAVGRSRLDLVLDGRHEEDGWRIGGRAWESQSGSFGSFDGWRRHRFLLSGTDFFSTAGRVAEISLVKEAELRIRNRLELVSSDSVLRVTRGAVFAINRLTFDNLQRLDPFADYRTAWQWSVGGGANPQDVALWDDDTGYVARYEPPFDDLGVFDPDRGPVTASIDLRPFAENRDGTPRPSRIAVTADGVFVALQDIDRTFTRYAEGKLVVVDPALGQAVDVVRLGGKNPIDIAVLTDADGREHLYVSLAGIFPGLVDQELSGGVVVVDARARVVEGLALDDDVAGGNLAALAVASDRLGYVVASDAAFVNRVLAFDPSTATILRTVRESTELIPDLALDSRGLLAVPDRRFFEPQVCLYRTPSDPGVVELPIGCLATELPPFSIEPLD